jgi:hypothetical protein
MGEGGEHDAAQGAHVPTDEEIRLAIARTLEKIYGHADASTKLLLQIHSRVEGALAGQAAVAKVVDANADEAMVERQIAAAKELISHLIEKSHQYVTIVIAGAFAAYFATLSMVSGRFSDEELAASTLLMTLSLTIFVMWEVVNIIYIGIIGMKGDATKLTAGMPRWQQIGWAAAMFSSLATALPAVGIALWVYVRHLGAAAWIHAPF